jgi:hypothetical protein
MEFYKSVIAGCFPEFKLKTLRFVGGSWCRVFIANGDTYFRFPHSDQALEEVPRQREVYEHLAGRLSVPVPRFTLYSTGCAAFPYPVAGYAQVPGIPLASQALTAKAAHQIGGFLKGLHAMAPPPRWKAQPVRTPSEEAQALFQRTAAMARLLTPVNCLAVKRGQQPIV